MGSHTIASVELQTSSPSSPGQTLTFAAALPSGSGFQSSGFPPLIVSATTNLQTQPTTSPEASLVPSSSALDNAPGDGGLTTEVVTTALVTSGVESVTVTSTAPDGRVTVFTSLSSFTRTSTGTTTIVTTRPTVSSYPGVKSNAGSYLGGFIAAALGLLLILVAALCFFRRQGRKRRRAVDESVDPYNMIELSTGNLGPPGEQHSYCQAEIGANISSAIPLPSQDTNSGAHHSKRGNRHISVVTPIPQHNTERDDSNPFQDPNTIEVHEARNALDRLQQLTRDVEIELQNLANQAQSGQLSAAERARLDEIRRTTGLTIMYDSRLRRFLSTSSASSAPPPSYHSDHVPISQ